MKTLVIFCFGFFCTNSLFGQANKHRCIALVNVTIIDVETGTAIPHQSVVVCNDIITEVGPLKSVIIPKGSTVVNGKNKFLIPGLWDSHVHLSYIGVSALPVLVANGITSVRDLGSIPSEVQGWQERIGKGSLVGPRIKASGYNIESDKWLDAATQIINASELLKSYQLFTIAPRFRVGNAADAKKAVDSLKHMRSDVIKFRNLGGENFFALAKEAKQSSILLVGHAPKGVSLAEASDAGMASIEHGETIFYNLSRLDSLARVSQFKRLIENGTMLTPTLLADFRSKLSTGKSMQEAIRDRSGILDTKNQFLSYSLRKMWQLAYDTRNLDNTDWKPILYQSNSYLSEAHRLGVQMLAGTDLGVILVYPGSGLHEELAMMVEKLGMSPTEALRTATINPARFFKVENTLGAIKVKNYADMILLNDNPLENINNTQTINAVILNGKYLDRKSLNKILKRAVADIKKGNSN